MKKRYFALLAVICLSLSLLGGCFLANDKEFSKAGMTITLNEKFTEKELVSQTAYYESFSAIVTVLKEEFSLSAGLENYTLEEYTNLVLANNDLKDTATVDKPEGKKYYSFTYEKTVNGKDFYYFATTFKGPDAFWLIQFACVKSQKNSKQKDFTKWADSVVFEQQA